MNIAHFLHKHTLSYIQEGNAQLNCIGCEKLISGPCYGCSYCEFFLHYQCAMLPQQYNHHFHPCPLFLTLYEYACSACFQEFSGFSYRCETCHFNMHVECVFRPAIKSEGEQLIQHFTHWHPLKLFNLKTNEGMGQVSCDICERLCSDSAYGCQQCHFYVHNSCMTTIPRKINHSFHSCTLVLVTYPNYTCLGCGKSRSGLCYKCGKCLFKLDAKCGLLPTVEAQGADMIQHFAHPHPLALALRHQNKDMVISKVGCRCRACGEDCSDPSFGCSRSCDFFLHKSCAELPKEIHHPFHNPHPLNLIFLPMQLQQQQQHARACSSCGQLLDEFLLAYICCYGCDFNLHKDCAKFTPSFKHENCLHALTLCGKRPSPFNCNICGNKANKFFLRCVVCGFNMHVYCLPSAPKTITHKCHLDSLTLTKSPLEFELNSSEDTDNADDEFYCDACEGKREKKEWIYYCAECKFIAEVGCVISELVPSYIISEDQDARSSRVISKDGKNSATDSNIENEIAELGAKSKLLIEEREPLKVEIEPLERRLGQLKARLQELEAELNQTTETLDTLEVKRFLSMYQPKQSTA